ncbi:MAG: glycosyltransferase family 2 protein, partial [Pirellulaceae bacterium]
VPVAPPQREPAANPGKLTDTSSRALAQLAQVSDALEAERERDFQPRPFPSLTVVIPVFNEERTILQIVAMVRELDIDKQIVVVDDGSTDGTRELLASLPASADLEIFFHESNQGKGAALQTGFRLAEGEIVIVQDADLEYDPADILKVIEPIRRGEAMVAYGSRYLESHHQNSSWLHRFGNWLLTKLSNTANGQHLTDMETFVSEKPRTRRFQSYRQ